jgi:hypothetical protein
MLRGVVWKLFTDVSGQPIGIIFKGQHEDCDVEVFTVLGCYATKISSYLPTFRVNLLVPYSRVHTPIVTFKSSLFWDVTRRKLVFNDVSGQFNGPVSKGQHVECNVAQPAQPDAARFRRPVHDNVQPSDGRSRTERGTTKLRFYRN